MATRSSTSSCRATRKRAPPRLHRRRRVRAHAHELHAGGGSLVTDSARLVPTSCAARDDRVEVALVDAHADEWLLRVASNPEELRLTHDNTEIDLRNATCSHVAGTLQRSIVHIHHVNAVSGYVEIACNAPQVTGTITFHTCAR